MVVYCGPLALVQSQILRHHEGSHQLLAFFGDKLIQLDNGITLTESMVSRYRAMVYKICRPGLIPRVARQIHHVTSCFRSHGRRSVRH